MRVRPVALVAVLSLGVPGLAQAKPASAQQLSFSVRQLLTQTSSTQLRGKVTFTRPAGWRVVAGGNRHSFVDLRVVEGQCTLDIGVSMRGVATRRPARELVPRAPISVDLLGGGDRPGGAWGTVGPVLAGGEGKPDIPGLYGIAAIRVAERRYGELRVFALLERCAATSPDAAALLDGDGQTVQQLNHLLAAARTSLRITR